MLRASIGRRTSDGTSGAAAYEIIAPADASIFLQELLVILAAATASTYGLGFPAAKGITPTTPVAFLTESGSDRVSRTTGAIAWATGPTVPANFFRRVSFPATISSSILWTFPKGLVIPAGRTLVLWNLALNGVVDATAVTDESVPA